MLIGVADQDRQIASMDNGTTWACASSGDRIYEGNYSIYLRKSTQSTYDQQLKGEQHFNVDRDPVQIVEFNEDKILAISESISLTGNDLSFYSIDKYSEGKIPMIYNGPEVSTITVFLNKVKVYDRASKRLTRWKDQISTIYFSK